MCKISLHKCKERKAVMEHFRSILPQASAKQLDKLIG